MRNLITILFVMLCAVSFGQGVHVTANNPGHPYYAKDWGFKGDSSTDNTPIFRNFILITPSGSDLWFDNGKFLFSDSVLFKGYSIHIHGTGMGGEKVFSDTTGNRSFQCAFYYTSSTKNFLVFDTSATNTSPGISIDNIAIINSSSVVPTAGAAIVVKNNVNSFHFENLRVRRFFIDYDFQATYYWSMVNCRIDWPVKIGIRLGNNIDADLGDWSIVGCIFQSGFYNVTDCVGFLWLAGGGGKVVNCKWNSSDYSTTPAHHFSKCIYATFTQGATSDFVCNNTSFENFDSTAIKMNNLSGGLVSHIQIDNVQISPVNNASSVQSAIDLNNFALVTINNAVGRNYVGSISHPFILLQNIVSGSISGQISVVDYSSVYSMVSCTNVTADYLLSNQISLASDATKNGVLVGTLGMECTGTNSCLVQENSTYSAGYTRNATGWADNFFFGAGEIAAQMSTVSAAGGTIPTFKIPLRWNATQVAIGGDVQSPTLAGLSSLYVDATSIKVADFAVPNGTTSDSVLVGTTSAGIMTVKKVAQSSIGGSGLSGLTATDLMVAQTSSSIGGDATLTYVTSTGQLALNKSQNAGTQFTVTNNNGGTGTNATVTVTDLTHYAQIGIFGTGATPYGAVGADNGYFYSNAPKFIFMNDNASGEIDIAIGTTPSAQDKFKANGSIVFGLYGAGTFTGTATKTAQFDASGNLIEGDAVSGGTWASSPANTTNIASSSETNVRYHRVGNTVFCQVGYGITPSLGSGAQTVLTLTLPFNTATTTQGAAGTGTWSDNAGAGVYTGAEVQIQSASTATIHFQATSTAAGILTASFAYKLN